MKCAVIYELLCGTGANLEVLFSSVTSYCDWAGLFSLTQCIKCNSTLKLVFMSLGCDVTPNLYRTLIYIDLF